MPNEELPYGKSRDKPWQFTAAEFIAGATPGEARRFDPAAFETAHRVLRGCMAFGLRFGVHVGELPDLKGRRVSLVTAASLGTLIFEAASQGLQLDFDGDGNRPDDISQSLLDDGGDGPGYLAFRIPPVVVLVGNDVANRKLAGWFYGRHLWVEPGFRDMGFGKALVSAAAALRGGLPFMGTEAGPCSEGGYRAIAAAHRDLVADAVLAGEPVPDDVLRDYPEAACAPAMRM